MRCPSTQTLQVSRLVLWKGEGGWNNLSDATLTAQA